ncbi:hypothetical protein [Janthinobacterium fluminis]|uniref:Uncharacterized protein n=1 Tax=Janthinobacterium fluminis TaxID=2987524 RepID=A0ABT5K002_9BURK|nr:hypothetical protein [Janthinobacterium fluminis]MDC8758296.1 hypothetical protein [Janthinobacterium fluminis]
MPAPPRPHLAGAALRTVATATLLALAACAGPAQRPLPIDGIAWQPDNATARPYGNWDRIGARELLIQWTLVDQTAFVDLAEAGAQAAPQLPDWGRIAAEPWARDVIVGLAGSFDENAARAGVARLAALSQRLAALPTPLHVSGWYFPVEVDPSWADARRLAALLAPLPRPLWISAYDSANIGADNFAAALAAWLPDDVGVLFQDGAGVYAREPRVARGYADALAARLGRARVRIIVEAFRPRVGGGFRSATVDELAPQLRAYAGYRRYLFDGPHYVNDALVQDIFKLLQEN